MEFHQTYAIIAQTAEPPAAPAGGEGTPQRPASPFGGGTMLFMLAMMILMFVITGRSQKKKQREHEAKLDAMRTGDEVISAGGIHGRITNKNKEKGTVTVQVAEGVKLKFSRASITEVIPKGSGDDGDDSEDEETES